MHRKLLHPDARSLFTLLVPFLWLMVCSLQLNAERMILHRLYSEQREPEIEELLYLAAGVEFTRAGLSSSRNAENPDYSLHTRYRREGEKLIVRYKLSRRASKRGAEETLAETEVNLRINHYFDLIIASTVNYLLKTAKIERSVSPDAQIEGVLPDEPESRSPEAAHPPDTDPRDRSENQDADGKAGDKAEKAAGRSTSAEVSEGPGRSHSEEYDGPGIYTAAGTGALMLLGEITEYFHYGLAGTVFAGLEWPRPGHSWQLGTRFNLIRVFKDKQTHGPPLYFSTAGVNLALGSGSQQLNRFYAGITGGAAFISVADPDGAMTKSVPYAEGNIAMRVPMGGSLFLKPDVAVLCIFDDDLLISGLLPSLSAGLEF